MFIFTGRNHFRNRYGTSLAIDADEGKVTGEAMLSLTGFGMLSEDLDANLHTGATRMIHLSSNDHDITHPDRAFKNQVVNRNRDTRLSAMP